MRELFFIKDNLAGKISYYHVLCLLASLPFNRFYSHIILVSFFIHTLIHLNSGPVKSVFKRHIFLLSSVFIITLLSTVYTLNLPEAYREWGRQAPILIVPLLFSLAPLDLVKYRQSLLLAFSLVCTATVVYLYLDALYVIYYYRLPLPSIFSAAFLNHNFSEPLDMHATFLSMQLFIALVFMVSVIAGSTSAANRLFCLGCACILTAGLFQLCSKSIFFCLFISINFAVPYFLFRGSGRWRFILVTVSLSAFAIAGILSMNTFKKRYLTDLQLDLSETAGAKTTDSRLDRWNAAAGLIIKSPVTGYGAGSEITILQKAFFDKKCYSSYLKKLNVHSQYLSFLLKAGIIGLLCYLVTLLCGFKKAVNEKDLLFFTFMLLVAVVSVSENLLDVDKGIFFYALFFSFFMFSAVSNKVHHVI